MPPQPEQPLARIPFTPEDEANLSGAALFAKLSGICLLVGVFFQLAANIIAGLAAGGPAMPMTIGIGVGGAIIGFVIAGLLAAFLFRAARAVEAVVTTDGADQFHLVEALRALRAYFMTQGILIIIGISLGCLCCVGFGLFLVLVGSAAR